MSKKKDVRGNLVRGVGEGGGGGSMQVIMQMQMNGVSDPVDLFVKTGR